MDDEKWTRRLFLEARTQNGWTSRPVGDEQLKQLYALVRMGPTSANCCPARFVFVRTPEGKAKLRPALSTANLDKTMSAPLTVIVAYDERFYDQLPRLFPHTDARSWFSDSPALAQATAFRNSSLQAGYLILAARLLGLDVGPMSGFDAKVLDEAFFAGTGLRSNMLINLGTGDPARVMPRLPRLEFEEACELV